MTGAGLMDDSEHLYRTPRAAAARFARLYGERPGTVRGIDYARLSMACCQTSHETHQDIGLEKMQEFIDLKGCFDRAFDVIGDFRLEDAWMKVRVGLEREWTQGDVAKLYDVSVRTVRRWLGTVDTAVREQLTERQLTEGYGGRDLLDAGSEFPRGVQVWRSEDEDEDE